jgi:hypothetical protein
VAFFVVVLSQPRRLSGAENRKFPKRTFDACCIGDIEFIFGYHAVECLAGYGEGLMRVIYTALLLIVLADRVYAQTAKNSRAIAIGPWQIEASFTKNRKFDRCVMRRTIEEGIEAQFTRGLTAFH